MEKLKLRILREYCDSCFDLLDHGRQERKDAEQIELEREEREHELRRRAGTDYDDDT